MPNENFSLAFMSHLLCKTTKNNLMGKIFSTNIV